MARRISDNKLTFVSRKEPVSHINRNALLALSFQTIDKQRQVDVFTNSTVLLAVFFQRRKLIFKDQLRIKQQTPDKRRLAVIYTAAGQKTQLVFVFLCKDIVRNRLISRQLGFEIHQKYPSRFFFSIDPESSWSIKRPSRSEVRAISISRTMAGRVSASDSNAAVSG